ncbi:MAG: hypothetical protein IKB93_05710 [Clostridia bacterium]|nr:hypothetical protein [Clostridia bacterium]
MKTKKLLSILMALMMVLSVVPFYASAEAVALTTDNVVVWPTTSGEIYFGQKLSDGITINSENALVTSDGTETGTVIPGKWEFIDTEFVPTAWSKTSKANIKFTPENTNEYIGFEVTKSANVTYVVNKTTPVFVDEINDPIVATDVEQGAKLSTSTLSGGQMKNPYTNEIIDKSWKWSSGSTIVNSTGEYKASFGGGSSYNKVEAMIMVKVIGTMKETEIVTPPEAVTVEYSASAKNSDLPLVGGKAVIKGTDTEVAGTFSFKAPDGAVGAVGEKSKTIVFTPNDTENYIASEGKMSVTVTKGSYKLVDKNGEEVTVPEFTLPYGTTFDTGGALGVAIKSMIKDRSLLTGADVAFVAFPEHEKDEIIHLGTHTYNVRIYPSHEDNSSYKSTYYQFVITIEPVTVEMKLSISIDKEQTINISTANSNDPYPQGTFDIYVDGALYMEDVKGSFPFDPGKSGKYDIKMVYNPVENDPCVVEEKTVTWTETYHRNLNRGNLVMGSTATVMYGKEVKLNANIPEENFGGWKITDANGNEVVLEDAVMEGRNITFTMPDFDITVEAIDKSADTSGGGIDDIFGDLGDLTEGDSDNPFENIINNLIAFFKNIINTIKNFFRGIGDLT